MTGPLAPLFAQVEAGLKARQRGTGSTRNTEPALAALSSIERHVQDMEKALEFYADEDNWEGTAGDGTASRVDDDGGSTARAALPASGTPEAAREKEEE